jgi:sugar-specific transcriptional regulator TrmB
MVSRTECLEAMKKFGISLTAAKAYIALLEVGKASADRVAKKSGTYKANAYEALEKLIDLGLVTYVHEGRKRLFIATNPEKLVDAVEESRQKAVEKCDELKKEIEKIMPQLVAKYSSIKEKNLFEVYRGESGFRTMIREILREKPEYWKGFGNLQVQAYFPQNFKSWFRHTKFILFATRSDMVEKRLGEARKTTKVEIKWLPEDMYMQIVWTLFGDNLLILIYEPEIIAFRIKSEQVVKTFSSQFDYLWERY